MSLKSSNLGPLTIFIVTVLALLLFLEQPEVPAGQAKKSIENIQKQAKLGDAHAQFLLGYLYDEGESVPKKLDKALKWYKKAAEQRHAKAYAWFNSAAVNGNVDAADHLGRLKKLMTKQQIANGKELSKTLLNAELRPNEYSKSDHGMQTQNIRKN
jgi:TPR repeat protein